MLISAAYGIAFGTLMFVANRMGRKEAREEYEQEQKDKDLDTELTINELNQRISDLETAGAIGGAQSETYRKMLSSIERQFRFAESQHQSEIEGLLQQGRENEKHLRQRLAELQEIVNHFTVENAVHSESDDETTPE